jgi:predicted dehydrogenase
MPSETNRRQFLGAAAPAAAFTILPRHVLGGQGYTAPSDKVTLAHIGMGTQGFNELGALLAEPDIQIVAVCDPNTDSEDYVEWSKGSIRSRIRQYLDDPNWRESSSGCPGGREVGRYVVDTYYAKQRGQEKFRACAAYEDFRELLEKEKDVDAVKIMTPDHLHATIAIAAMKKGKHVLVHKPLANRMYEARLVIETARKTRVATHLLAYGSGAENGRIAAKIKEGVIGPLREIHNWTNRPVWPQYTSIPSDRPPIPKGFNWDLWLGPCLDRPYHPHYTHTVFRGWYDFGGGSMADMGIYSLWPVFAELNLESPVSAQAWATHHCDIVDGVSRPVRNDWSYPAGCTIRFQFAARAGMPELELYWYDGGMKPRLPAEVEPPDGQIPAEGILFVGDRGKIIAGFNGQNPRLIAGGKVTSLWPEEQAASQRGRQQQTPGRRATPVWLPALKGGPPSPGNFLSAAAISDAVCLGTVALRAGRKVLFDSAAMKITNTAEANKYLYREYRPGWEL